MSAILGTALLVTLTRPASWVLALAMFLIRGGMVWFLVPILVLPTPVGLSNALGPTIVDFVLGGPTPGLMVVMFAGAGLVVLWVVAGGSAAAAIEVELIEAVVTDEEVVPIEGDGAVTPAPAGRTLRVLAIRLLALVPLLVAAVVATTRIVSVTYGELTLPSSAAPLVWRVLQAVPDAVLLILLTWIAGETVATLAARRVVLGDPSIRRALVGAMSDVLRHPLRVAGLVVVPSVVLLLVLIPAAAAATVSWTGLRAALVTRAEPIVVVGALVAFVALWAGGLALTGAVCAWRQAAWTVAAVPWGRGTFGGSATGRPGDWKSAESSGTL
jgi:hypothetical protein